MFLLASLTIFLLISKPFSRARWKKFFANFFFDIANDTKSSLDAVKCASRIEIEEKEERHEKRVQLCLVESNESVLRHDSQNNEDKVDR